MFIELLISLIWLHNFFISHTKEVWREYIGLHSFVHLAAMWLAEKVIVLHFTSVVLNAILHLFTMVFFLLWRTFKMLYALVLYVQFAGLVDCCFFFSHYLEPFCIGVMLFYNTLSGKFTLQVFSCNNTRNNWWTWCSSNCTSCNRTILFHMLA